MKIYELIKIINKKVTIKTSKIMEIKKYYMSLYRVNMVYMYMNYYISDPTVFDVRELHGNILDLRIKYLTGTNGKIELSEDFIGYAICRYKNNKEVLDFLEPLYKVVKYRNISLNLDKFYDALSFAGESKKKVCLNLVQSASKVFSKHGIPLDEGVLRCFLDDGLGVKFFSIDGIIYNKALEVLGISDSGSGSLFVDGLSREEEVRYSRLILNGLVSLDGVYADRLIRWLGDNKWASGKRFSAQSEGLYNWILHMHSDLDIMESQSCLLNRLIDNGYEVACMRSDGFYVIDRSESVEFPVGLFAVRSDDDIEDQLPEINKFEGYTGEVYSVEFLDSNEFEYVGCPVELFVDNKKKELFVDKEQTEFKGSESWFKHVGASLYFTESFYNEGVFPAGSLEDRLYRILGDSEEGKLIGYLTSDENGKVLDSAKRAVSKKLQI